MDATPELAREVSGRILSELERVIVGQKEIISLLLASIYCRGHCLLIGVPGLAKTLLVKSLAEVVGLSFSRIQFTPDLMPSDIIGSEILKDTAGRLEFEYKHGPIFANLILADEINRTPPKTQAALLEAMQEHRVTVAGESNVLPDPFLVVATQNPIEHEGTYPLPEAQLDRFMFSLHLGYPAKIEEIEVVRRTTFEKVPTLEARVGLEEILAVQELVRAVPVSDHVLQYAVDLVTASRPGTAGAPRVTEEFVEWGAGPRASQYLVLGAKALALFQGKKSPETSDVRQVVRPVLQHRIVLNYRAAGAGMKPETLIDGLIKAVPEAKYAK